MKFPDAEVFAVVAVVAAASWAYARFVDGDPDLANRLFVRVFVSTAVVLALYTAYVNFSGPSESFPFDADTKAGLDVI